MDAKTKIKASLPSRHVTERPKCAPHRSYYYAMGLTTAQIHRPFVTLFDVSKVFKKTSYVADLKPRGRYVAKDMFEAGGKIGDALHGAVAGPGGAAEKSYHADI